MQESGPTPSPNADEPKAAVDSNSTELVAIPEAARSKPPIYMLSVASGTSQPLCCGEILSSVVQRRQTLRSLRENEPEIEQIIHPFCIVVSQDCDLEQDFKVRQNAKALPLLPNVLLCEVSTADELRGTISGSDIWKRIRENKDERYQFLQAVPSGLDGLGQALPDLGVDFRRYFVVPTDELYEQFNIDASRRCRLISPFKEHFMNRFAHFMSRVALPLEHFVKR